MADELTLGFNLNLPAFDKPFYDEDLNDNFRVIDAVMSRYIAIFGVKGVWKNSTLYAVTDVAVDGVLGSLWKCLVAHSSPGAPVTFLASRTAHPDYWEEIVNASQTVTEEEQALLDAAVAAAAASAASATASSTSATDADASETQAGLYAVAAAASAVVAGSTMTATSTSSNTIGAGSFTFTTQANKSFQAGQPIIASSVADSTNYIHGTVSSYSGTTLVITSIDNGGSGTISNWNIAASGTRGTQGSGVSQWVTDTNGIRYNGNISLGQASQPERRINLGGAFNPTGNAFDIISNTSFGAGVTNATSFCSNVGTAALSALTSYTSFQSNLSSVGGTVNAYYAFDTGSNALATSNYGFSGSISSAVNNWNLYISGTAKNYIAAQLGLGTSTPDASAKLEVVSTTQGILFPRMTSTQKTNITLPLSGLVVYDTTLGKLCVRGAAAWETITSV